MLHLVGIEGYFPHAVFFLFESIAWIFAPIVERAREEYGSCIRSPFAEHPAAVGCVVKSEIVVGVGEIAERAIGSNQFNLFSEHIFVAAVDCVGIRFEPRVVLYDGEDFLFHIQI